MGRDPPGREPGPACHPDQGGGPLNILALESSATACSVALCRDGELVAQSFQNSGLTHSRTLLPMVHDLLKNCGESLDKVDVIAVAAGPGSFTGLRIGVATAKGLAWGEDKDCAPCSTLESMAWPLAHMEGELIVCAMDARRNQVRGEALALRAMHHFDIYRLFAPDVKLDKDARILPYQLKFGVETPAVYTTQEYLNLVVGDLENALECLKDDPICSVVPYELGNGVDENKDQADQYVARMNYYAAKALLARVYLDMGGEYKKEARRLAEEVIESKKFALLDYEKSLNVDMADKDLLFSSEHIFSLRNQAIKTGAEAIHKRVTGSDGNLQMAVGFQSSIYEGDLDDYRLNWYSEIYIVKYTSDNSKRFFPKVPIIRLSEMYLIAAEGWMEDDPGHAAELLQTFKQARTQKEVVSQEVTEDVIMREIRKEFIGEGVIFLTYKRLHHDIWGNTSEDQVKADNNVFVFPIPEDEIEYGNRTQN